ncbi:ero1-like protein isoform X2 [Homarus americanus]|uniref:ero1-like protein isoform X2 n=1 Tax=Homarus americanus TaxID=6706 RepID=UPI001C4572FF|nr:ero1-like protein isoform X2 [Homarus americanus]
MWWRTCVCVVLVVVVHTSRAQWFGGQQKASKGDTAAGERCFCQLKGAIDDCSCSVETIDSFNNLRIYPRLNSLLQKNFFRYWKVNLNKKCPFWEDDSRCAIRYCSVKPCTDQEDSVNPTRNKDNPQSLASKRTSMNLSISEGVDPEKIPEGIKGTVSPNGNDGSHMLKKKTSHTSTPDCDAEKALGYLNMTLSKESIDEFERWAAHDSAQDSFCDLEDESSVDSEYVDLLLNPERYTGYVGPSTHRIWRSIYQENCFKPTGRVQSYMDFSNIGELCLEKRAFYRAVSGLHSSINIHLAARYLLSDKNGFAEANDGVWGHNVEEFQRRFDPELTGGEGPLRLKNLYFLYLLELRALAKAAPYLESLEFYTGNDVEDSEVRKAVRDLVTIVKSFQEHFDEGTMFTGGFQATKLKTEFRDHFRNITRIMDCVGCDKCRLWGKLQITGLGTALKILFSGNFDQPLDQQLDLSTVRQTRFQLSRGEIVSLFNAFGRLSSSIMELENFRHKSLR